MKTTAPPPPLLFLLLVAAKICDSHIMGLHVAPSRKRLQQARRAAKKPSS